MPVTTAAVAETTAVNTTAVTTVTPRTQKLNTVKAQEITTTTVTYAPAVQGKPVFHLSSTEVCLDDAVSKKQHVELIVDGANGMYCNSLIYLYYDKRMKVGEAYCGPAASKLACAQAAGDTDDFIVLVTAGFENYGKDGVMWEIDFTLPEDCEVGDEFKFEVGPAPYGEEPLFTNIAYDEVGMAMTQHIFTEGLAQGSIKVIDNPPYELGDVNNDKLIDAADASKILAEYALRSSGKNSKFNKQQRVAADVNTDGVIDAVDASLVLGFYAYVSGNGDVNSLVEYIERKGRMI